MNVLIDLDGTLLDFKQGEMNAVKETIFHFTGLNLNDEQINKFSEINEYYFNQYKNNKMNRDQFHYMRFKDFYSYLGIEKDILESDKYYINSLKYQSNVYDDVFEFLDYLNGKYRLFIASNGMTDVQIKRLEIAKINKYFERIYVSEKIEYNKPDIEFFNYIFDDLNDYERNNYVIIGDRLDSDILGAINVNIKTIYINRDNISSNDIKPNYVIRSLKEIKNIL